MINLLNSFRSYEILMMVLTRSATVSTINSDGSFQLGGQRVVDHGLCSVWYGVQQTGDWIQCQKWFLNGFIPNVSKYQRKNYFNYPFLKISYFVQLNQHFCNDASINIWLSFQFQLRNLMHVLYLVHFQAMKWSNNKHQNWNIHP